MTMEERAMRAMLAALPGAHDEIVIALKEMCFVAAKTVFDETYIGPNEKQLDDIAEAAATRINTGRSVLWKIVDPADGVVVRTTPFNVVKHHQKYIKRNTAGRKKIEQELALMRQQLDEMVERMNNSETYFDDQTCASFEDVKAIVIAITASELKHDKRLTHAPHTPSLSCRKRTIILPPFNVSPKLVSVRTSRYLLGTVGVHVVVVPSSRNVGL